MIIIEGAGLYGEDYQGESRKEFGSMKAMYRQIILTFKMAGQLN